MRSDRGGKKQNTVPSMPASLSLVHEQDLKHVRLEAGINKLENDTKRPTAFDKCDTDSLITQKHSMHDGFCRYRHDLAKVTFPHWKSKMEKIPPCGAYFPLRACWRLSASTDRPAASIQHHLIQQLKGKQKLSQPSCQLISKHADVAPVRQFLLLESASDLHERRVLLTRFHANTVVTALVASCYLWDSLVSVAVGGLTKLERNVDLTLCW